MRWMYIVHQDILIQQDFSDCSQVARFQGSLCLLLLRCCCHVLAVRWSLEELSTSTRTNAIYSLRVMRQLQDGQPLQHHNRSKQIISVVLITNPFHQLRSYFTFRKAAKQAGMDIQVSECCAVDVMQPDAVYLLIFVARCTEKGLFSAIAVCTSRRSTHAELSCLCCSVMPASLNLPILYFMLQLYVAEAPFAGHHGYGSALLDCAMDQLDFWRELAAIAWYWVRGYL